MTERLYLGDSLLLAFDAGVIGHGAWQGRPSVILDRSAFYPESGGQMADRGVLAGRAVVDVQVDDAGVVHHVLDGELPAVGAEVHGEVERARRRLFMALHTGQHMLSKALVEVARAETVSSRLGETDCTIDVDKEALPDAKVAAAEDLVNAIIDEDVRVRAFFPTPDELCALPLRRPPKVTEKVRVVQIGDFDVSPCGGTHCATSAQVGLVHVTGSERYKGKLRLFFSAGARARSELAIEAGLLHALARSMTCGPAAVPAAVESLRRDLGDARDSLKRASEKVAVALAVELAGEADARGEAQIVACLDEGGPDAIRALAKELTKAGARVAVLGARGADGVALVVARGPESSFDCGALVKRLTAAAGGRGGGRPERAEARLPADADLGSLVAADRATPRA